MNIIDLYRKQRLDSIEIFSACKPKRTINSFFGVGPITNMAKDEYDAKKKKLEFDLWVEQNYPKLDDKGNVIGNFTVAEFNRSMHRGYPADKVLLDMVREIHRYFEFPKKNKMAVGLGGGHSGFTVAALHFMNPNDPKQRVYVDTPKPESERANTGGFFRQSWGIQLIELQNSAQNGDVSRLHFSEEEGAIPDADTLEKLGITLFFGVGHETTGATTYTQKEIKNLLEWIRRNPAKHHAIIDGTSLLGSMIWNDEEIKGMLSLCNIFTPFQKAVGGVSGYFVLTLTPEAVTHIDETVNHSPWSIPRQFKISVPENPKKALSGKHSTHLGPIYHAEKDVMQGGIINTYSILAFAETTFAVIESGRNIGPVSEVNKRSKKNRELVNQWIAKNKIFSHGVENPESRGAAVTLLKVNDQDISDDGLHGRIIQRAKQIVGYEGVTHPNGNYEPGIDVARFINAFPGTPGDFRAWIGGIRPEEDITALLENLKWAYHKAKALILEEELEKLGVTFEEKNADENLARKDDADRAYKVLVADLIGMKFNAAGDPDYSEVQSHIESKGGVFHVGSLKEKPATQKGKIHFYYQPDLSREDEILAETSQGEYDALIAAATFIPSAAKFEFGGVRIGAGTGNMGSASWGAGNGTGGSAPLMNTPGFNSRATAHAAFKALLKVRPDLSCAAMYDLVKAGKFDTGKDLKKFPCTKLEGKKIAIIGYGNIGREMAKLAKAFQMNVTVYARQSHKTWIESEGFEYADSILSAAKNADVLSPHIGLGSLDAGTGKFSNAGIITSDVLQSMNSDSILINYDRGELVDIDGLDNALTSGKLSHVAVDADIFVGGDGAVTGPLAPYLSLLSKHADKMELLPHAAADTEHVSRVEGAKQAVDQIYDVIQYRRAVNLKGDLPEGYTNGGSKTPVNVGKVEADHIMELTDDNIKNMRELSESLYTFWSSVDAIKEPDRRADLVKKYSSKTTLDANKLISQLNRLGLSGPFSTS